MANAQSTLHTLRQAEPRTKIAANQPSGKTNGITQIRSAMRNENPRFIAGKSESILPVNEMIECFFPLADHKPSVRFDPRPTALQRLLTDQRLVNKLESSRRAPLPQSPIGRTFPDPRQD